MPKFLGIIVRNKFKIQEKDNEKKKDKRLEKHGIVCKTMDKSKILEVHKYFRIVSSNDQSKSFAC